MHRRNTPPAAPSRTRPPRPRRGVALIELVVTTAVVAIAAVAAARGMPQLQSRQQVALAAAEFETDVQLARSLAVLHGTPIRLEFFNGPQGACYVIHRGPRGGCTCEPDVPPSCTGGVEPLRAAGFGAGKRMTVASNLRSLAFDPVAGTVSPAGTLRLTASDGSTLHQVVNVMGRVRTCSPRGAWPGYRSC